MNPLKITKNSHTGRLFFGWKIPISCKSLTKITADMFKVAGNVAAIMTTCIVYSQKINHQSNTALKMNNASILHEANEFVKKGQYENFLAYCTEDTKWVFVGERILVGKEELRAYMKEVYWEPPVFTVETTIEDGNFVTVTGEITLKTKEGESHQYDYCDVWRFENGKLAALKAYVIEKKVLTHDAQPKN